MKADTYKEHLNDLQVEIEELRAKLAAYQSTMGQLSGAAQSTKTDTISRQAAIDAICKACANGDDYVNCRDRDIKSSWCDYMVALRDLPSAQQEQRKGKWVNGYCSICGDHALYWALSTGYCSSPYCPNCGADMRGEE